MVEVNVWWQRSHILNIDTCRLKVGKVSQHPVHLRDNARYHQEQSCSAATDRFIGSGASAGGHRAPIRP